MELKFFDKSITVGFGKKFEKTDLNGENVVYGGILFGTKGGGYALINWIEETHEEDNQLLNSVVEIV